jgi:hypothetical protein
MKDNVLYDEDLVIPPEFGMTIREIHTLHRVLLAGFAQRSHVCLALPEDAAVDLSFIQLIEAARRHAASQGKTIRLAAPAGTQVRAVLERGGFLSRSAPDAFRFWLHEEFA